jgi:hypothetical protein
MLVSLDDMRHTPLHQIPEDKADDIVREILRRQDPGREAVDVARFGSSV